MMPLATSSSDQSPDQWIPATGVCLPTFVVTYKKLQALTEDIFLHIHKENSVLFPRFA
jgi:iron-sulfur cluster repair protein YtfE (RIC family)